MKTLKFFQFFFHNFNIFFFRKYSVHSQIFKLTLSLIVGFIFWISIREINVFEQLLDKTIFSEIMTNGLLKILSMSLSIFGFKTTIIGDTLDINNARGIRIIFTCLALSHMGLITGLIISYPGKFINKIWFIPASIFMVYLLNAFRLFLIALVLIFSPKYDEFAHYFFTRIILYFGILLLWLIWIKYFSEKKISQ